VLAAGSGELTIAAGASSLKLEYFGPGVFQGDWLELIPVTGIQSTAWSAVKQFYK